MTEEETVAANAAADAAEFTSAFADATAESNAATGIADVELIDEPNLTPSAAPAAAASDTPAAPAAGTAPASRPAPLAPSELDTLLAAADPRVRAALEAAQQGQRSNSGRITAYQRQIAELTATRTAPANDANAPAADNAADLFADPVWKEALENYGDVLNPVVNAMRAMQAKLDGLTGTVTADHTARAARTADEVQGAEEAAVRTEHPDLDAIISNQSFADWANARPHLMPTIAANGKAIVDATAVIPLLAQFKRETGWGTTPPPANPNAARRERQLAASRATPSGGQNGATPKGADDFSGAFKEASAKG